MQKDPNSRREDFLELIDEVQSQLTDASDVMADLRDLVESTFPHTNNSDFLDDFKND